jgi:hypothetical protein
MNSSIGVCLLTTPNAWLVHVVKRAESIARPFCSADIRKVSGSLTHGERQHQSSFWMSFWTKDMILLPSCLVSLLAVTIASFLWTRLSKPLGLVDYIVNFYTFSTVRYRRRLHPLTTISVSTLPVRGSWPDRMAVCANLGDSLLTVRDRSACFRRVALPEITPIRKELHRLSSSEKRLLTALAATATAVGILNFVVLVSTARTQRR